MTTFRFRAILGAVGALALHCGCQRAHDARSVSPARFVRWDSRPGELQVRVHDFSQRFAGAVEAAADEILAESSEKDVRRNALLWKVHAIPACQVASFRDSSVEALLDLWALCSQLRHYLESGAGRNLFGEHQEIAVRAARELESGVVEIAAGVATDDGLETAYRLVDDWVRLHPIRGPVFAGLSILPRFADGVLEPGRPGRSRRPARVSAEKRLTDLLSRLRAYLEHLPKQGRWQAELLLGELLESDRIEKAAVDLDTLTQDVTRITRMVERFPAIVAGDTQAVAGVIQTERVAALAEIDGQRTETIRELRNERQGFVEALRAERAATVQEIEKAANRTLAQAVPVGQTILDHLFWRATQFAAAGLVLVAVLWTLVRLFWSAPR